VRLQPDIVIASEHNLADMAKPSRWSSCARCATGAAAASRQSASSCWFGRAAHGQAAARLADCLAGLDRPRR
jgi:hypothetical protein